MFDPSTYQQPAITVDAVALSFGKSYKGEGRSTKPAIKILLVKRADEPFTGQWTLPGTFVHIDEDFDDALERMLEEKLYADPNKVRMEQLYTFSYCDRDPRGRVISAAHLAIVRSVDEFKCVPGNNVEDVQWADISFTEGQAPVYILPSGEEVRSLGFDHDDIVATALSRIANKIEYTDIALSFLPEQFTIGDMQKVYEAFLGKTLDRSNFRKFAMRFVKLAPGTGMGKSRQLYILNPVWKNVPWR